MRNLLAFDIGASNGRAILGQFDGERISMRELHRFENHYVEMNGIYYWDLPYIYNQLKQGFLAFRRADIGALDCFGIDTWGVDYGLLDKNGHLLSNPRAYRNAVEEDCTEAWKAMDFPALFAHTGIGNESPRESPRHFAARMDESVIVGYYTSAEVHPRSPARLLLSKERKKPMARNDGIDRTFARNQDLPTLDDVTKVQEHNEREKDSYSNQDIDTTQTHRNVHFKKPTDSYAAMFDQMIADGVISTRGLKADAVKYGELLFDVNSAYFHNHGGYEYAKQFYADAYKAAVEIVGGEQYILSAVMHADERNRAMSEALGEDVYHYHLHVVYIPVVEKQILWSKRCKDESLRGTVKETITQVSRSKKWESKPVLDENGNPMLNAKGKKILKSSYSVLQDDFFNFMRNAGYTDVERGECGSTEEHLTVTQFKVQAEQQRLEAVTGQVAQAEQSLADAKAATEKQKKKLEALKKETQAAKSVAMTAHEIESMGKKNPITGNVTMTADECRTLKDYAVSSFAEKSEKLKYKQKFEQADKNAKIWKDRFEKLNKDYEELKQKAQPFLDAIEIASEKVWAFINAILARGKELYEHKHPARNRGQDMEI